MAIGNLKANLAGYLGKATQWGREIWAPIEFNGAFPVNIQDQHSLSLDLNFIKGLAAPTTISAVASPGDRTLTVTSTTGFAAGVTVGMSGGGNFYFGKQVGALAGNVVTVDTPIDKKFAAGAFVFPASHSMNVDGSTVTQIFQIGPVGVASGIDIDITRVMGYIQSGSAVDDAKFGDLAALTNGVVLRIGHNGSGTYTNLWNVKTNGEIGLLAFDAALSDRAPSGSFGFRFRNTYAGQSKHGVTLRLAPGETLELLVQDNLTGLEDYRQAAQGHYVTD